MSNGVHPSFLCHERLLSQREYWMARAYSSGSPAHARMAARARGTCTRKTASADPFCVGVYRTDRSRCRACSSQKSKASFDTYSGPPSDSHTPVGGQPMDAINACHILYASTSVAAVRSLQNTASLTLE